MDFIQCNDSITYLVKYVKFKKLHPDAIPFSYTRPDDVCMDMYVLGNHIIPSNTVKIIPTGIALEIPIGYEGQVRGRSGLTSKGILVQLGTIENSYRGEVGIITYNSTDKDFEIKNGMRLAQFSIHPITIVKMLESELTETKRGDNGYGSSGW